MSDTVDYASKLDSAHRAQAVSPVDCPPCSYAAPPKSEGSSGYASSSTSPNSPQSGSPPHTLKRSKSSSFRLINRRVSTVSVCSAPPSAPDRLAAVIGWYPAFLMKVYFELLFAFLVVLLQHLPLLIPTLWASACLWLFWKSVSLPFVVARFVLLALLVPGGRGQRRRRTVLITGGSTVQSVYLARNFYSSGARVVCCDAAGRFQLARFSSAVSRYYTVPAVDELRVDEYVEAIRAIAEREECEYFIPVSAAHGAYFDALAKPHLELRGCASVCPDAEDVLLLDDLSAVLRHAERAGLPVPGYHDVTSYQHLNRLYESGRVKERAHLMRSCGAAGCQAPAAYELPRSRRHFRLVSAINEQRPWVVVPAPAGERYVTCTTVRDSRVLCNVTCRLTKLDGLAPVDEPEIERWLGRFFEALRERRPRVVGHVSFYFGRDPETGALVPTDCQVGVRTPYICYTSVQSRLVCKPCRHFSRSKSGPIVDNGSKYWLDKVVLDTVTHLSPAGLWNLLGAFFVRQDALFVFWDPLPYCAYYYLQRPLAKFYDVVRKYAAN